MGGGKWVVYLVRCIDNSLYCGISNDYKSRLDEHNSGKGAKYTRSRRPVYLVGISSEMTKSEALKLERRIKKFPAGKKISELKRKEKEMAIEKDLKTLKKEFKALEKKMEKLIAAVEKSAKSVSGKKITAKSVKAKLTKKAPAKKAAAKKTTKMTATDQVLEIIKEGEKGVNVATLIEKTGFDVKKVQNILHRTYKLGKIKRVAKGVYMTA